jgi:hypothetical protein
MAKKKLSRNIKPREQATAAERTLRQPQEDGPSTFIPSGDYTINPKASGVRLERFSSCWSNEGSRAGFRIWGGLDETDPEGNLYRGRLGGAVGELGGMSFYGPVIVAPFLGIGPRDPHFPNAQGQKSTFIIAKEAPRVSSLRWKKNLKTVDNVYKEGVEFWQLPYPAFYDACKNAFKAGKFASGGPKWDSEWNALMDNSDGKAPIVDMKERYFMVGHFYELGPDFNTQYQILKHWDGQKETTSSIERKGIPLGLGANDPLIVAWMSGNAGDKVQQLCNRLKEDWSGDEVDNPALPYKYGDPCGVYDKESGCVEGGLIFTMFNPSMYQPSSYTNSTWDGVVPKQGDISSYQVAVSRSFTAADGTKYSGDMTAEEAQKVLDKNLYAWPQDGDADDSTLLHESTIEEEMIHICDGFKDVPKIVEFGLQSHPEYLDFDSVKAILRNRTVVSMPDEAFEEEEEAEVVSQTTETVEQVDDPAVVVSSSDAAEFDEEAGGEIEAEEQPSTGAADDDEFDEFAQAFVEDGPFEEDKDKSVEFDPEAEAEELSESMGESLSKAGKALAKSAKRSSPRRKLNPPS